MNEIKTLAEMSDKINKTKLESNNENKILPDRWEGKKPDIIVIEKSPELPDWWNYPEVMSVADGSENEFPENERRPLTPEEREYYREKLGCTDAQLDKMTIDENGKIYLKTDNEGKEGTEGNNGVKYERKTVVINGIEVEGVFPVFDSTFDVQLPEDKIIASDKDQNEHCNEKLKEAVENDPELAKQFTPEQLEQIKNGETPDGYTWHHNEERGKMELVKTDDHQSNRHTGGVAIWGNGQR